MPGPHILLTGLAFGESPRWHDGRLWFANWGTQEIVGLDLDGKERGRWPASRPPCRTPSTGCPTATAGGVGREAVVLRQEPDGPLVTHADLSSLGAVFNEIVVDGRGNTYVNGGGFDPTAGAAFSSGIVALITPDGSARQVADGIAFGNGMAVTPDNSTLIVAESYGQRLTAFDIGADGSLSNRRVWADLGDGVPDGICIDAEGAVWYADVPNQRCVRVREGGEVLQTIELDRGCFACMLGGADRRTLFMMAAEWHGMENMISEARTGQVLIAEVPVPGAGWP